MKYIYILFAAFIAVGCSSTSSNNQADTPISVANSSRPILETTVAAQSLKAWPYESAKLSYVLKNKNIAVSKVKDAQSFAEWDGIVDEVLKTKLNALGLHEAQGKANLIIQYSVTPPTSDKATADLVFDSLGVTAGSNKRGTNGSIEISIIDNFTKQNIWTGAISTTSNKPITTKEMKRFVVEKLLSKLVKKLPKAQ